MSRKAASRMGYRFGRVGAACDNGGTNTYGPDNGVCTSGRGLIDANKERQL